MKLQNHISKQGSPQQPISRTFQMVALSLSPDQLELVALSRDLQHAGAFCSPGFCANRNWFCPQEVNSNRKIPSLINPSFPTQFPTRLYSWHPDTHQAPKRFLLSLLLRRPGLADQQQVTAVPGTPPQPSVETSGSPALEEPPNFYPGPGSGTIMEPT